MVNYEYSIIIIYISEDVENNSQGIKNNFSTITYDFFHFSTLTCWMPTSIISPPRWNELILLEYILLYNIGTLDVLQTFYLPLQFINRNLVFHSIIIKGIFLKINALIQPSD